MYYYSIPCNKGNNKNNNFLRCIFFMVLFLSQYILAADDIPGKLNYTQVLELRGNDNVIIITPENYEKLNVRLSNDYYQVLYLTMGVNEETGEEICQFCLPFERTFRKVSNLIEEKFNNISDDKKILFYVSEVEKNGQLIADFNLTAVPHILMYPPIDEYEPNGTPISWALSSFYEYNLPENSVDDPLRMIDFIGQAMQETFDLSLYDDDNNRNDNEYESFFSNYEWSELITNFIVYVSIFIIIKKLFLRYLTIDDKILDNDPRYKMFKIIINKIMIIFCFLLIFGILLPSISGYKFTQINEIIFIARNDEGKIMYFSGGQGWQFGIEVLTVSLMYIGLSSLLISLIYIYKIFEKMNKDGNNNNIIIIGNIIILILAIGIYYGFDYYISCYEIKSPGYPFSY